MTNPDTPMTTDEALAVIDQAAFALRYAGAKAEGVEQTLALRAHVSAMQARVEAAEQREVIARGAHAAALDHIAALEAAAGEMADAYAEHYASGPGSDEYDRLNAAAATLRGLLGKGGENDGSG